MKTMGNVIFGLLLLGGMPLAVRAQFTFVTNADNTIAITGYSGGGTAVIPGVINGKQVTSIGPWAFSGVFSNPTNVIIPDSVTSIGEAAFNNNPQLLCVTVGAGVTNIANYAFVGCIQLRAVYFQGNAPSFEGSLFDDRLSGRPVFVLAYYLPWTSGWSLSFAGIPTMLLNSQNLAQNGGFETGNFTGWMFVGKGSDLGLIYNAVLDTTQFNSFGYLLVTHSGRCGVLLGDNQVATLSQTISTLPGHSYLVSFWLNNFTNGTFQMFKVNWLDSNNGSNNSLYSIENPPAFTWTKAFQQKP